MNIEENISLKEFTTFGIGGKARYFVRIKEIQDLQIAIAFAHGHKVPIFVLGGGSNIVMSDEGFPGLVIKMEIDGVDVNPEKDGKVIVSAGAGENWDLFVERMVQEGLFGIENLSLIPGTVGAAPVQNIGAYGAEVKNVIEWVEALDQETGVMRHFNNEECDFNYRMSIFKKPEGKKYVITRVGFALKKNGGLNISYRDIAEYIKTNNVTELSLLKVREIVIDIRTKKLPDLREYGTAGSFFKNPIIATSTYEELVTKHPHMPGFPTEKGNMIKVPAAWILDNLCGFKGHRDGTVGVYKNQALVLVNFGGAKATDIKKLAEKMIACVKDKTGIILEREVEYI
ncbi:MAG: UDP-N-acetylenolpyruvoylglucosamine reductase, UDP-N-acetylmuramate dehydrogenase [Candidatus Paceibacter sp.]|nr:UDP-N-acetylenolpyruvoylglucosamine reductase, UDP-N-acetylmuramate dehydrogenase [Candidatus Paceibacter sp.]